MVRPAETLDFLVSVIDNYGDTGFALDLAESLLKVRPNWRVRFFSNERRVFDRLTSDAPHPGFEYLDLDSYESYAPSETILSFFDRRLPERHFAEHPFKKKILQFSYLQFDPFALSLDRTRYPLGTDEVVHFVPTPLSGGAGIVVGNFDADDAVPKPWARPETPSVSVFCYTDSADKIRRIRTAMPEARFCGFWSERFDDSMPFQRFNAYAATLKTFDANIVRGENSAIKALLAGTPFLWDFYKEDNGAHLEKIEDFLTFMHPFFEKIEDFDAYARATRTFNAPVFGDADAKGCADVLRSSESLAQAFRAAAGTVRGRDITKTVLFEIGA